MAVALCTLFNSLYLDKGLVLYDSLKERCSDFELYVLCMDEKCYEVLSELNPTHLIPINLEDFECEELLNVKPSRSFGEYCWTCSSWLISYVLEKYKPESCTYIDADMFFYQDPKELLNEMDERNASVLIVGHRFYPFLAAEKEHIVGRFCVEFNSFKNVESARGLLNKWKYQVLDHCSLDGDGVYWGDQKYMDNWLQDYPFVIESSHLGAGVAPWNISQYKLDASSNGLTLRVNSQIVPLVFYHFENIQYLNRERVNTGIECFWGIDKKLVRLLYVDYLRKIKSKKAFLKDQYGIDVLIKSHPGVSSSTPRLSERIRSYSTRIWTVIKDVKSLPGRFKRFFLCSVPMILYKRLKFVDF